MKVLLFANSHWGIPIMDKLYKSEQLAGLVLTDLDHEPNEVLVSYAKEGSIPYIQVNKDQLQASLIDWMAEIGPDISICITFPYKLPDEIINIPSYGTVNYHFGALPEYAGPDPLFWTLKNKERVAKLTAHKMTDKMDSGELLFVEQMTIFPGESHGLLGARMSQMAAQTLDRLFEKVAKAEHGEQLGENPTAFKRPTLDDLTISWSSQEADDIEALVNASNPPYKGAITYLKGGMVRILEVSPATVNNASLISPGTIVHADAQNGIFVLCKDLRFLRINILETREAGVMSGFRLAALGLKSGEKFTEQPVQNQHQVVQPLQQ